MLTGRRFYAPAEDAVWSAVKLTARVLSGKGYVVVIDATHCTVAQRASWIRIAEDIGVTISCVHFDVPVEVARERNVGREFPVPESVFDRMAESFVIPTKEEGFDAVHIVESS